MAVELDELIEFLSSPSQQVKKAAVDIVRGLTGSEEGICTLASRGGSLCGPLLGLLVSEQEFSQAAAEALVNLSQKPQFAETVIKAGAIERAMDLVGRPVEKDMNRLLVLLLVNLTQMELGTKCLLQGGDKLEGLFVRKLVRLFTKSKEEELEDPYEHVSSILLNITKLEAGRKLLLDGKKGLLKLILPQFDSKSVVRRKGVAGTLRNCCFEAETELPSLLLASQYLWPTLLLPLAGKKAYRDEDTAKMPLELASPLSHEREPEVDPQIRIEAAEALYLIAVHDGGRRALWAVNGPRVLQVGYEDEEDPQVMEAYERLGSLLIDESGLQNHATEA